MSVKIGKVTIEFNKKVLELSIDELKELKKVLEDLFPSRTTEYIPFYPYIPYYPYIYKYWTVSTTGQTISISQSSNH